MFCFASLALVATAASVSGLVVPRAAPPAGWATKYLEPYDTYHTRYLAIGCSSKHNTSFFNQCCHPLLAKQDAAAVLPASCLSALSASPTSAVSASLTSSAITPAASDDDEEECDDDSDDGDDSSSPIVVTSTPAVMTTSNPTQVPSPTITPVTSTSHTPSETPSEARVQPTPASQTQTGGFATYFYQNGVAGACGTVHKDSDFIAAIDEARYGNSGVKSSLCGKQVKITNPANKKSVVVTIADDCPTCNNANSIDLSKAAFQQIATLEQGMVSINWSFI